MKIKFFQILSILTLAISTVTDGHTQSCEMPGGSWSQSCDDSDLSSYNSPRFGLECYLSAWCNQPGQNDPVSTEFRWFAVNGTPNLNNCDGNLTDKTCKSSESKKKKKNKKENYHES